MLTDIELGHFAVSHEPVLIPGIERIGNVLIEGDSGTGKTRCLKSILHQDIQAIAEGKQDVKMVVIASEESMRDIEGHASRSYLNWSSIYSRALQTNSPHEMQYFDDLRKLLWMGPDVSPSKCNQVLDQCGLLRPFTYCMEQNSEIGFLYTGYQEIDTLIGAAFVHYLACNMGRKPMDPIILYIDELHRYAVQAPHAVAKLFEFGRELGISLIVTVQSTEQLNTAESPYLSEVVKRNTRFHVKMRTSEDRDTLNLALNQAFWVTPTTRDVIEISTYLETNQ
ncbi:hypothetical protein IW967_00975 [Alicyclobacillus mali]|uniref:Uncharacterized protein n=1 Tax=Alicyclobacillus mali (ex Roth et al. 2021) TaxID=1123961 RepID=A0ABS0EZJ7_9BACL|nr:hypothetical protein [Alicyclobacillus mali (ex Roth et al. 2021)]MBF8376462.1 hypothetical protein [Alicyclobacillus mali (ex Roth et al. 2021)]